MIESEGCILLTSYLLRHHKLCVDDIVIVNK